MVVGLYVKIYDKKAKSGYTWNAIKWKLSDILNLKFNTTILEQVFKLCLNFKLVSFELSVE